MGLGRGFLLAGSRSVLVSLWPVASKPTVDFMGRFYKHLLEGRSKSESLKLTQVEFIQGENAGFDLTERGVKVVRTIDEKRDFRHPFYWAPFVLIGE